MSEQKIRLPLESGFLKNIQVPGCEPWRIQITPNGANVDYIDLEQGGAFRQPVDRNGRISGPAVPVKGPPKN